MKSIVFFWFRTNLERLEAEVFDFPVGVGRILEGLSFFFFVVCLFFCGLWEDFGGLEAEVNYFLQVLEGLWRARG